MTRNAGSQSCSSWCRPPNNGRRVDEGRHEPERACHSQQPENVGLSCPHFGGAPPSQTQGSDRSGNGTLIWPRWLDYIGNDLSRAWFKMTTAVYNLIRIATLDAEDA